MATEAEKKAFFDKYSGWAITTQSRSGVPASITLAQAALESNWGTSKLATTANNFFGIKCSKYWFGECVDAFDVTPSKFRKYKSVYDSFIDHADFLMDNKRYNGCFKDTNYRNWAECLLTSGYTGTPPQTPSYAKDLIATIEKNGLVKYDTEGDIQMGTLSNTLIRNRRKLYIITFVIVILLVALWFVGKKFIK